MISGQGNKVFQLTMVLDTGQVAFGGTMPAAARFVYLNKKSVREATDAGDVSKIESVMTDRPNPPEREEYTEWMVFSRVGSSIIFDMDTAEISDVLYVEVRSDQA